MTPEQKFAVSALLGASDAVTELARFAHDGAAEQGPFEQDVPGLIAASLTIALRILPTLKFSDQLLLIALTKYLEDDER